MVNDQNKTIEEKADQNQPTADIVIQSNNQLQDLSMDLASQNASGGGSATGQTTAAGMGISAQELEMKIAKFEVPAVVLDEQRPLVELIVVTESMNDEERQYWFHILPIMSDEQIQKLRQILVTEQRKLADLNQAYEARITEVNEQYLLDWQKEKTEQRKAELKEAEMAEEASEEKTEEQLLSQLEGL